MKDTFSEGMDVVLEACVEACGVSMCVVCRVRRVSCVGGVPVVCRWCVCVCVCQCLCVGVCVCVCVDDTLIHKCHTKHIDRRNHPKNRKGAVPI